MTMRILVVEDDKDVAGFVVKGLREAGHTVEHADNGRDGLFLAASENFDAIILDRMLPGGIDGLRLMETLRAQDNATPVLFLPVNLETQSGRVTSTSRWLAVEGVHDGHRVDAALEELEAREFIDRHVVPRRARAGTLERREVRSLPRQVVMVEERSTAL